MTTQTPQPNPAAAAGNRRQLVIFAALALAAIPAGLALNWYAHRPSDLDATITSCEAAGRTATVTITITNRGSAARTAKVDIEYRDGSGARIDTDSVRLRDIAPGDTVRSSETTILDVTPAGTVKCAIGVR